jgi:hypothetical protein
MGGILMTWYNAFDVFKENDTFYIVTRTVDGMIKEKMPLREFCERNYLIEIDGSFLTINELLDKLENNFIERYLRKDL